MAEASGTVTEIERRETPDELRTKNAYLEERAEELATEIAGRDERVAELSESLDQAREENQALLQRTAQAERYERTFSRRLSDLTDAVTRAQGSGKP